MGRTAGPGLAAGEGAGLPQLKVRGGIIATLETYRPGGYQLILRTLQPHHVAGGLQQVSKTLQELLAVLASCCPGVCVCVVCVCACVCVCVSVCVCMCVCV